MNALGWVLVFVVALLALPLFLPVRVRVLWRENPRVWAGLGPVMLALWPQKPSKKPKKRRQKPVGAKPKAKPKKRKQGFRFAKLTPKLLLDYVKLGKQTLGRMFRAVKISRLELHAIVSASDPGAAALSYGAATAATATLASLLDKNIKWRNADVLIEVDFEGNAALNADVIVRATPAILLFTALRAYRQFKALNAAALEAEQGSKSEEPLTETAKTQ